MSYLNKYKVGSILFRSLSEGRMRLHGLYNYIRYRYSPPDSIIGVEEYISNHGDRSDYEKISDSFLFQLPETSIKPEAARRFLEKNKQVEFPESFVLRIRNGRILGDGTVIVENNTILSETTTDFHRIQEFHHFLSAIRIPEPIQFDGRLAVITSPGSDNYFHWTLDALPRFSLLEKYKDKIDAYYVDNRNPFHREWLRMLNIPPSKIIVASPESHIQASELIVPSFAGLPGLPAPDGVDYVRKFLPDDTGCRTRRIYVSRADSRRRRILNEAEIFPLLQKQGFEILHPGKMSVAQQIETFASAAVVVSPHGAELANLVFCNAGTKVVEIFSPYYLNPCFKQLAAVRGMDYAALIGNGNSRILHGNEEPHHVWANIRVNLKSFNDLIASLGSI